ncbi:respiratory nitrate reductase subunit gamma [Psychrobacter lutiphocae]|uniref:respiratory nitrate reductase subunit gamma n=1 Tax=Psychrobacter lutiphocae TaxID=540500 RepID=UPI00036C9B28|nr:respiratory nitrate reductase subunit gamma [Psychrobacter lutiphocae]
MNISDPNLQNLANLNWLQIFLFGIYPYIALVVAIIGTWARFDLSQYSWKTGSSQMLRKKNMRAASNLFHIGIIGILLGHFVGLLTPHWVYEPFITAPQKQLLAMVAGGIAGVVCWIGMIMLIIRRFTDDRISHTSSMSDKLVLIILFVQLNLGLLTIVASTSHMDGGTMMQLASWAQNITVFRPLQALSSIEGTSVVYQLHIALGITLILIFPFTRLIHIISAPVWYLGRRYQIVRQK